MKENLFILFILILVCVHFVISDPFKPVVLPKPQKEIKVIEIKPKTQIVKPEIIPTTTITNVTTTEKQTYTMFNAKDGLFRINHKTGEVHYFSVGLFIPVTEVTREQLRKAIGNNLLQQAPSKY